MISYLIASYNHESYLLALLESLKLDIQSLSVAAEVVIIDDGSTDNSPEIIKNWMNENKNEIDVSFTLFSENKGIPTVLNRLIELSNGELLRFSGSDDILIEGSTQKLFEVFAGKPNLLCAFADATVIDDKGFTISESSIDYHGGNVEKLSCPKSFKKELIQSWCLAGPSFLIKRRHYDFMMYDETLTIDDYDLYLSLLEKKDSLSFLNCVVCKYRIHNANSSKNKSRNKRVENLTSFLHIINKYIATGCLKKELLPVKYKTIAKINYLNRSYMESVKYLAMFVIFKIKFLS